MKMITAQQEAMSELSALDTIKPCLDTGRKALLAALGSKPGLLPVLKAPAMTPAGVDFFSSFFHWQKETAVHAGHVH